MQDRKRAEVLEEQQRRMQEAAAGPGPVDYDDVDLTGQERALVMKAMGGMEDGDAILGSGAEVNLESQVCTLCMDCPIMLRSSCHHC